MIRDIPDEILINILSWLPSKSLLQFRCVCKSWNSIISDCYFWTRHHHHFNSNNAYPLFVSLNSSTHRTMYLSFYDKYFSAVGHQALQLNLEIHSDDKDVVLKNGKILSSDQGVLCICLDTLDGYAHRSDSTVYYKIYLYNPSIRQLRLVIDFSIGIKEVFYREKGIKIGFGFASQSKDYKVVLIRKDLGELYSLRSNTWSPILAKPRSRAFNPCSTYLNGVCHWLISKDTIMCFNLDTEDFDYIMLPQFDYHPLDNLVLFLYEDMLAFLCFSTTVIYPGTVSWKAWVMKEYGVQHSWTPLITGSHDLSQEPSSNVGEHQVLVSSYSVAGTFVIMWLPQSKESMILRVEDSNRVFPSDESLVLLHN